MTVEELFSLGFTYDPLLSDKEAADVVGAKPSTLKQSRHSGVLFGKAAPSFVKMGRSARYKLSTLISFREQFPEYQNTSQIEEDEKE